MPIRTQRPRRKRRQAAEQRYRRAEELRTPSADRAGQAESRDRDRTGHASRPRRGRRVFAGARRTAAPVLLRHRTLASVGCRPSRHPRPHGDPAIRGVGRSRRRTDEPDRRRRRSTKPSRPVGRCLGSRPCQQADAAGTPPPDDAATPRANPFAGSSRAAAQQAGAQQAAEKLAEAAAEVRKAGGRMHSAGTLLADAAPKALPCRRNWNRRWTTK